MRAREEPLRERDALDVLRVREDEDRDREAVVRERDAVDRDRDAVVVRRLPVGRCDAGISAVATAFVSCGISFSR